MGIAYRILKIPSTDFIIVYFILLVVVPDLQGAGVRDLWHFPKMVITNFRRKSSFSKRQNCVSNKKGLYFDSRISYHRAQHFQNVNQALYAFAPTPPKIYWILSLALLVADKWEKGTNWAAALRSTSKELCIRAPHKK